jgi:hypothetical protein
MDQALNTFEFGASVTSRLNEDARLVCYESNSGDVQERNWHRVVEGEELKGAANVEVWCLKVGSWNRHLRNQVFQHRVSDSSWGMVDQAQ